MSVWESTLQRHVPQESLSRVSSYDWFGSYAFYPLGLALWGSVAGAIGIHTSLWIAFGLFALSVASLLALPDTRRFGAAGAEATLDVGSARWARECRWWRRCWRWSCSR